MNTVLVTGAAGRVGANVVRRLVSEGARVRALVVPDDPQRSKLDRFDEVEVVEGDLRDQASLERACRGATHVLHLAAQMVRGETPVDLFYDINAVSALRLLEAARTQGTVERFVLASTDATFRPGDSPPLPLTEAAPQRPVNHYGMSKLLAETIVRHRAPEYGIGYVIVRFATVLSPDEADSFFRVAFQRGWVETQYAIGRESTVWPLLADPGLRATVAAAVGDAAPDAAVGFVGPGGVWRLSMVDVRDAAHGAVCALTAPGVDGGEFNLAAAEPVDYAEAATLIADRYGVERLIVQMPMTWRLEFDISRARQGLGFAPEFDYADTLAAANAAEDFVAAAEGNHGVYAKLSGRAE